MTDITRKRIYQTASVVSVVVFILSTFVVATYAWNNYLQHKTNETEGLPVTALVVLEKLEKTLAGTETGNVVAGSEFLLYRVEEGVDVQIGGIYVTDNNGQIRLQGVGKGSYYFIETDPGTNHTYDIDDGGSEITRYDFEITGFELEWKITVTAYNRRLEGPLHIEKVVANSDGSALTAEQRDLSFEFRVTFSDGGTYFYTIDGGLPQVLVSGSVLYLKHGETAYFGAIARGVTYLVEETKHPDYSVRSNNHQGTIAGTVSHVLFTNTLDEHPGKLTVAKTVTGMGADLSREFGFTATIDGVEYTFTLRHGQSKTFENLPAGTAYSIIEGDYTTEGYIAIPASYQGRTIDNELVLPFVNVYDDESGEDGSLEIGKVVVNADGSALTSAQQNQEFEFTVTIGNTSQIVHLKGGESVTFADIATGTAYKVEEAAVGGYRAGITVAEGIIVSNHNAEVTFVNEAVDHPGRLIVTKKVIGTGADTDKQFVFSVIIAGQVHTFTLRDGQSKVFDNLPMGTPYRVVENDYADEGYVSAPQSYEGRIIEGSLTLPFINVRDDGTEDLGSLEITKQVINADGTELTQAQVDREFTFIVTIDGASETIVLRHGQSKLYTNLAKGSTYRVEELPSPGYIAAITVAEGIITSNHTSEITFINQRPRPLDPRVRELLVYKILEGRYPQSDEGKPFTFRMTINGTSTTFTLVAGQDIEPFLVFAGDVWSLEEIEIDVNYRLVRIANGSGVVGADDTLIIVEAVNEYIGDFPLDIEGEKFWVRGTHSPTLPQSVTLRLKRGEVTVHEITVMPDADGRWTYAFPTVAQYDGDGNEIIYTIEEVAIRNWSASYSGHNVTNTYVPPVVLEGIEVKKAILGANAPLTTFEFLLTSLEGAPMPEGLAGMSKSIHITGAGTADFGSVIYHEPGTYTYEITEMLGSGIGWSYDSSRYVLKIVVEQQDGALVVTSKTLTKAGITNPAILFTNHYEGDDVGEFIDIVGTKRWVHGSNVAANHPKEIVVIVRANGSIVATRLVSDANEWKYSFTLPRFDVSGKEMIYTIDEQAVEGYEKTTEGYSLVNTYKAPDRPKDPGDTPKTSDVIGFGSALICLIGSLIILVLLRRDFRSRVYP